MSAAAEWARRRASADEGSDVSPLIFRDSSPAVTPTAAERIKSATIYFLAGMTIGGIIGAVVTGAVVSASQPLPLPEL